MLEPYNKTKQILIGLDLGQSQDYTALSIIEIQQRFSPILSKAGVLQFDYGKYEKDGELLHYIRHLTRFPLGTTYPDIVRMVYKLFFDLYNNHKIKPTLIIDSTGVGKPVFDMFTEAELKPKGITITGGNNVNREGNIFNVPKRDLVGVLQVLFQNNRIKISGSLPTKKTLYDELINFRVKISETGHDSYEAWRSRDHDDMVLSVAVACWYAERSQNRRVRSISKGDLGMR
jgi:hypothetical protein